MQQQKYSTFTANGQWSSIYQDGNINWLRSKTKQNGEKKRMKGAHGFYHEIESNAIVLWFNSIHCLQLVLSNRLIFTTFHLYMFTLAFGYNQFVRLLIIRHILNTIQPLNLHQPLYIQILCCTLI